MKRLFRRAVAVMLPVTLALALVLTTVWGGDAFLTITDDARREAGEGESASFVSTGAESTPDEDDTTGMGAESHTDAADTTSALHREGCTLTTEHIAPDECKTSNELDGQSPESYPTQAGPDAQAQLDARAAAQVDALILALDELATGTEPDEAAIREAYQAAQTAYGALTNGTKALVVNAGLLADYARALGGTGNDTPNTLEEPAALTAPPAEYVRPVTIEVAYNKEFTDGYQKVYWDEDDGYNYSSTAPNYYPVTLNNFSLDSTKDSLYLRWALDTTYSLNLRKPVEISFQNEGGWGETSSFLFLLKTAYTTDNKSGIAKIPMKYLNFSNGYSDGISLTFFEKEYPGYESCVRIKLGEFTAANKIDISSYIGTYKTENMDHTLTIHDDFSSQYDSESRPNSGKLISYSPLEIDENGEIISATINANSSSVNRYFLWNEAEQTLTLVRIGDNPVEKDEQLVFTRVPSPVELLSGGTKKGYDTLSAAFSAASDGDTIELNADIAENVSIDKAFQLTLNGNGHKLIAATGNAITVNADRVDLGINGLTVEAKGSGGRAINVDYNCAASFSLEDCTLRVNQRGISYNGTSSATNKLTGIKLELDNTTIENSQVSDYEKDVKIDGNCRGISLYDIKESTVTLKNSAIQGFGYSVNVSATQDENGVSDTQGLVVTVEDSELFGWTSFNIWGSQATYNITGSKILGINTSNGSSDSFSAITFNDDIYKQFQNSHAVNNVLNITNSTIQNYQSGSCTEELLRIDCGISQLNLYGTVKFVDTTGNIAAALYLNYMEDYETFLKNNVHIYGTVETNRLIGGQSSEMSFAPTLIGINTYVNNGKTLQSNVFDFASFIPGIDYADAAKSEEKLILYSDVDASTFEVNSEEGHGNQFGGWTLDLNGHKLTVKEWNADKVTVTDFAGGGQIIVGGKSILTAENGGYRYPTIQAAVKAAKDGDTVTVIADVTLAEPISIDKPITLKGDASHTITVSYADAGTDGNAPFQIKVSGVTLESLNVTLAVNTFNVVHFGGQRANLKYNTFRAADGAAIRKAFNSIGGGSQLTENTVVSGSQTCPDGSKTGLLSVRTSGGSDVKVGAILIQENLFQGFYKGVSVDNNTALVPVLVSQNKFVGVPYPFEATAATVDHFTIAYNYSGGNVPSLKNAATDGELTGDGLPSVYPYYTDASMTTLKTAPDSGADVSTSSLADETISDVNDAISNLTPENVTDDNKNTVNHAVEDITSLPNHTLTSSGAKETITVLEGLYVAANDNVDKTDVTCNVSQLPAGKPVHVTGAALSVPTNSDHKAKAQLVIQSASQPESLPIDTPADATVLSFEITLNIIKAADSAALQEAIQPRTPIVLTMPVPTGVNPDNIVILHYHANSLPATIYPIVDRAKGTMTFTVTKLSTFVVTNYVRKSSPTPSSPSYGSGYYDEYLNTTNYWDGMIDSIRGIGSGGAIIANAPNHTLVPTRVLQYLKGKNITLTLRLADGSISINGAKMGEVHSDWIYYTFEDLKNEFSDAAPDRTVPDPETPTPSVTAPSITYPELGNESPTPEETVVTEMPETPNTPQTSGTDQKEEKPADEAKPVESPASPQEIPTEINPWAVTAIIAACLILIGMIVFFVLRFRRRR